MRCKIDTAFTRFPVRCLHNPAPKRLIKPILRASKESDAAEFDLALFTPLMVASAALLVHHCVHPSDAVAAMDVLQSDGHSHSPTELYRLAENEDFWSNMARYSRFFVSVMIGTAYTILKPFGQLLKNPVSAVVLIGGTVLLYLFVSSTLKGMLGLTDMDM